MKGLASVVVTRHACQRFVERVRLTASESEARAALEAAAARASHTGLRTARGHVYWTVDEPPMRLITKHDPVVGAVLVTVLGPGEEPDEDEGRISPRAFEETVRLVCGGPDPRWLAIEPKIREAKAFREEQLAKLRKRQTDQERSLRQMTTTARGRSSAERVRASHITALRAQEKRNKNALVQILRGVVTVAQIEAIMAGAPWPTRREEVQR